MTFSLAPYICTYDKIQIINDVLHKINSSYRQINRRADIETFLVAISSKNDLSNLCTILIRHTHQLLDKTVYARIKLITEIVCDVDPDAIVFTPYAGLEVNLQRYHLQEIMGHYSINTIQPHQILKLEDCVPHYQ